MRIYANEFSFYYAGSLIFLSLHGREKFTRKKKKKKSCHSEEWKSIKRKIASSSIFGKTWRNGRLWNNSVTVASRISAWHQRISRDRNFERRKKKKKEIPTRFPTCDRNVPITCVASEYGVRESLFTSNDPNMMGTPEELVGLSCCVGSIFVPLPKQLHVTLHFNWTTASRSATRITIPRALSPAKGSRGLFPSSSHPR